jgi:hypothetical protein
MRRYILSQLFVKPLIQALMTEVLSSIFEKKYDFTVRLRGCFGTYGGMPSFVQVCAKKE